MNLTELNKQIKACSKCHQVKPIVEFYKRPERPSGVRSRCKVCSKQMADDWRRANLKRVANYKRLYGSTSKGTWQIIRANAKQKGRSYPPLQEFTDWYDQQKHTCHYCHREEAYFVGLVAPYNTRLHIDRKDSNRGYEINNIVLACSVCNKLKGSNLSEKEMMELAIQLFRRTL